FRDHGFTVGHGAQARRIDEEKLLLHADFASSFAGHNHSVPGPVVRSVSEQSRWRRLRQNACERNANAWLTIVATSLASCRGASASAAACRPPHVPTTRPVGSSDTSTDASP